MVTTISVRRGPPRSIPERRVLEIWLSSIQRRTDLVTEEYGPVRVIYPGRPNDGRGPDLKDAVIAARQGIITGDIEIHVKSSDWRAHGHHLDPSYNRVILHIVLQDDLAGKTVLENGAVIPTLALANFAEIQPARRVSSAFSPVLASPCKTNPATAAILDAAGEARFREKSAFFHDGILKTGPEEALYRGIMTALGYSKNKEPMAALAALVPLKELEEIMAGAATVNARLLQLQSRLLGMAGLLPSQNEKEPSLDTHEIELEQLWKNHCPGMPAEAWRFFKVRPGNAPVRRIAGMSYLLVRFSRQGILNGVQTVLVNVADNSGRALTETLMVPAADYWKCYLDFGLPAAGKAPSLIGEDRAAEIVINVVLPFFASYGHTTGQPLLLKKARDIYHLFPPPPENSLEKHMRKQLGLQQEMAATAQRRQGLIYLYKTFCTQGKCGECPFSGNS